jgi:hypothetical protein
MNGADLSTVLDLVVLGGIGGLWFRLGAVLQGQTDNRRRMDALEAQTSDFQNRINKLELQR